MQDCDRREDGLSKRNSVASMIMQVFDSGHVFFYYMPRRKHLNSFKGVVHQVDPS